MTREEFNDILRNAVSREFDDIPQDVPEHVFSAKFERRMNRLLLSVEKYGTTPLRAFCKRGTTIAATVFILTIAATQVRAISEPIVNVISKVYDIYKELAFDGDVSTTITKEYALGYIP